MVNIYVGKGQNPNQKRTDSGQQKDRFPRGKGQNPNQKRTDSGQQKDRFPRGKGQETEKKGQKTGAAAHGKYIPW